GQAQPAIRAIKCERWSGSHICILADVPPRSAYTECQLMRASNETQIIRGVERIRSEESFHARSTAEGKPAIDCDDRVFRNACVSGYTDIGWSEHFGTPPMNGRSVHGQTIGVDRVRIDQICIAE